MIVLQIGAAWRLSESLEEAYVEHRRNNRTLRRFQHLGLNVLDVRPERLMETISKCMVKHLPLGAQRKPVEVKAWKPQSAANTNVGGPQYYHS